MGCENCDAGFVSSSSRDGFQALQRQCKTETDSSPTGDDLPSRPAHPSPPFADLANPLQAIEYRGFLPKDDTRTSPGDPQPRLYAITVHALADTVSMTLPPKPYSFSVKRNGDNELQRLDDVAFPVLRRAVRQDHMSNPKTPELFRLSRKDRLVVRMDAQSGSRHGATPWGSRSLS